MKPSGALASNRAAIRHIIGSHRARNARVFGSALHGEDTDGDLDILIDPTPETTLFDIGAIRHELGSACGGSPGMTRDQQRLADYLAHIIEAPTFMGEPAVCPATTWKSGGRPTIAG